MDHSITYCGLITFLLFSLGLGAQPTAREQEDLFDARHSLQFARYLTISQQHQQAAAEYERLVFLHPETDTFKWELIRSYRLANQAPTAWSRYQYFFLPDARVPPSIAKEMGYALLKAQMQPELHFLLNTTPVFPEKDSVQLLMGYHFIQDQLPQCEILAQQYPFIQNTPVFDIINQRKSLRLKSPFLAAGLSAMIPGLGKV